MVSDVTVGCSEIDFIFQDCRILVKEQIPTSGDDDDNDDGRGGGGNHDHHDHNERIACTDREGFVNSPPPPASLSLSLLSDPLFSFIYTVVTLVKRLILPCHCQPQPRHFLPTLPLRYRPANYWI